MTIRCIMVGCMAALGNNRGRNGQFWAMIVLVPFRNILCKNDKEHTEDHNGHKQENDTEHITAHKHDIHFPLL